MTESPPSGICWFYQLCFNSIIKAEPSGLTIRRIVMNPFVRKIAAIVMLALALSITIKAQTSGNASLRGTVTDPTGAVVPQARITLREDATQADRTATTNSDGTYSFVALLPGSYTLTVEAAGFKA
jgi:protocatechuate 3,4-dioxygenase beta subunit